MSRPRPSSRKNATGADLAKLPFEKKIEIVIELQKAVAGIPKDAWHLIWQLWS
jgi:hypothetical protein